MGRATDDFTRYAKAAGLPLPPAGALAGYAAKVLAKIPALRAQCDDSTRLHSLEEMESIAVGLLRWIELAAETPRPTGRARAVFTTHAEAAGLPVPPQGELGEYATEVLGAESDDSETLHHLQVMEKAAAALLRWIEKPSPKPTGTPVPANHRLEQRAALRRAAMRAQPRSTVQDGWAD